MKRSLSCSIIFCLAVLLILSSTAFAKGNVLVVTGISEAGAKAVGTYFDVYEGIKEVLGSESITPEFKFVELHNLKDDAAKSAKGGEVAAEINSSKPDLVIAVGDTALRFIGLKVQDAPVIFTYMFAEPAQYGLPKANITGVARGSYASDTWEMASGFFGAKSVMMYGKKIITMQKIVEKLTKYGPMLEKKSGVKFLGGNLFDTFDQWSAAVENCPADMIYLTYTSRITRNGQEMPSAELVQWTVEKAKVPVIAAQESDVASGALFAIVVSERQMGIKAGEMALKVLNGTSVNDIPIATTTKGKLVINAKTAEKKKVDIPFDILSTAEKIYE